MTPQPSFSWRAATPGRRHLATGMAVAFVLLALLGAIASVSARTGDAEASPSPTINQSQFKKSRIATGPRVVAKPVVTKFYATRPARCHSVIDVDFVPFTWATENTYNVSIHADGPYDGTSYNNLLIANTQTFRVRCEQASQPFTLTAKGVGGTTTKTTVVAIERY